jgi:hypothetical protein
MTCKDMALWLGLAGTALQLLGSVMTLWGLLSATQGAWHRFKALVGALFRTPGSAAAAALSQLNPDSRLRVLQGLAVLALGYVCALVSQAWLMWLG